MRLPAPLDLQRRSRRNAHEALAVLEQRRRDRREADTATSAARAAAEHDGQRQASS